MSETLEAPVTSRRAEASGNGAPPETVEVRSPATDEVVGRAERTRLEDLDRMLERARTAQVEWAALGFEGRAKVLRRAQRWTTDNADRIASTIVSETGKTHEDALLAEVAYAANAFGFWAKNAPRYLADQRVRTSSPFVLGRQLVVRYAPVGVVGVIGPWNYPLTNSFGDCIPALAAGNATILKPATLTPLTSLLMRDGLAACGLPADVYQVAVGGGAELGDALIDRVDFVMFTGSTEVGKKVAERAARTLTPVGLELGGKDPMIVLADADLERAANSAVYYSMQNAGQTCISVERAYVEEPVYDEFVALVEDKLRDLRQGVPERLGSVDVGAVTSPPQVEVIQAHVDDALAKGARVLVGGHRRGGEGTFFEPTLLVDVDHSMACMTEETFGPTLPVMRVASADEAIGLANDSPFGLQSSVWTRDRERGERLARQLETGVCCVNDACVNYVALELPMGGWKDSGLGTRHGADGIRKYTKQQSILVTRFAPRRELHYFPYRRPMSNLIGRLIRLAWGRGRRD